MRKIFLIFFTRYMSTALSMSFGYVAFRVDDGIAHSVALVLWTAFTIIALEMWADRINRGKP